jgi:hypothetical protein
MKVKAILHQAEEGGFWAEVPALPGCVTQGETEEEVTSNLREAIELWPRWTPVIAEWHRMIASSSWPCETGFGQRPGEDRSAEGLELGPDQGQSTILSSCRGVGSASSFQSTAIAPEDRAAPSFNEDSGIGRERFVKELTRSLQRMAGCASSLQFWSVVRRGSILC